ncbi:hypothetical protein BGZ95_002966 [Linnemannia exigua]|uniref:Uncharacterized protein n=1 Tax=Linnemannia exigua TaxID=604196 RepID=A0AAD4D4V5_9FUNG|nr:hypothetical protein BGZ95_002966 [Linnemannia exigua]
MRLQLPSPASAILLVVVLSLHTLETQAQAQTQSKNPNYHLQAHTIISAQQLQQQQEPTEACTTCLRTLLPNAYPVCANLQISFNDTNKNVVEELLKLPLLARACFCVGVEPKTIELCTSTDTCGPLSEVTKNDLANYARCCAELGPQDAAARANALKGGDGKTAAPAAGLKLVVADSVLYAGLVALVAAAVTAVVL